jgi:hypothetical protein
LPWLAKSQAGTIGRRFAAAKYSLSREAQPLTAELTIIGDPGRLARIC